MVFRRIILNKKDRQQAVKFISLVVVVVLFYGCLSKNRYIDMKPNNPAVMVEFNNCAKIAWQASNPIPIDQLEDEPVEVYGKVSVCNSKYTPVTRLLFISEEGDTVANIITNKKGEFRDTLNTDVFKGRVDADAGLYYACLPIASMGVHYRSFEMDIRLMASPLVDVDYLPLTLKEQREIERNYRQKEKERRKKEKR